MRVLVTGGTGFVGRRLIGRLRGRGDEVVVLSRDPASAAKTVSVDRILGWDPASGPAPREAFAGVGGVVNLMGESIAGKRWSEVRKDRIRASRVLGTRNLVAAILAAEASRPPSGQPRVLVTGSAVGYYGAREDATILDETSPAGDDFLADVCRAWEAEGERAREAGVRVVRLRTGIALGREGGVLAAMLLPFQLGLGGRIGSGRQWMSWIHADDLCSLILLALDRDDAEGPINGSAPEPVTQAEFARAFGNALERPTIVPMPAFAVRALFGEMGEALLLRGQRVVPRRAQALGFRYRFERLERALGDLFSSRGASGA